MRHGHENCRRWAFVESLEHRLLLSADVTPPTARFVVESFMTAPQWIVITFRDNDWISTRSVNRSRIRLVGPNGYSVVSNSDGWRDTETAPFRVEYDVPAPGGSWDPGDDGRYTVTLSRNVRDRSGNYVRNPKLGHFDVAISGTGRVQGLVGSDDPRAMGGVKVYADANDNAVLDAGELSILSKGSGAFVLDLQVGSHRIRQEIPAGYQLLKSLPPEASMDDAGTGGVLDVVVRQSEITQAGKFINSLFYLDINGTNADDQISLMPDPLGVAVTINGVTQVQSLAGFNALRVRGGEGDDAITIDEGVQLAARIYGDGGDDTLRGGGGTSTIRGGDGADEIFGGSGIDSIAGGNDLNPGGPDQMIGADAADTIRGGEGDDYIYGGAGDDLMFGEGGKDWIRSRFGAATIHGGDGNDIIDCNESEGPATLHGDGGNDTVVGGTQGDRLFGGTGNDTLNGGWGADTLLGGSGKDVLRSDDQFHRGDILDGGAGADKGIIDPSDDVLRIEGVKKMKPWSCPLLICSPDVDIDCFLTTAVVHWAGKQDDCRELTVLRRFRDGYMRGLAQGEAMIRDYYQHAPRVVEAIEEQGRGDEEWPRVYAMVQEAVSLIEAGRNSEALELYAAEYRRLKAEYVEVGVV